MTSPENVFPNQNVSHDAGWEVWDYSKIVAIDADPISTGEGASNADIEHNYASMTSSDVDTVTLLSFKIYAKGLGSTTLTCRAYIDGGYLASRTITLTTSYVTYTKTWDGSWSKAQVDAMHLELTATASGAKDGIIIDRIYCAVTYDVLPTGYDKVINGVSDYTHINGVAIADITAWNGVT